MNFRNFGAHPRTGQPGAAPFKLGAFRNSLKSGGRHEFKEE